MDASPDTPELELQTVEPVEPLRATIAELAAVQLATTDHSIPPHEDGDDTELRYTKGQFTRAISREVGKLVGKYKGLERKANERIAELELAIAGDVTDDDVVDRSYEQRIGRLLERHETQLRSAIQSAVETTLERMKNHGG